MNAISIIYGSERAGSSVAEGYRFGDLVFLSGQLALLPDGRIVDPHNVDRQIDFILERIRRLLTAAGSDTRLIVKLMIYITDESVFPRIMEMRRRWFVPPYPADTIVEVARLRHPDALLEIEATAMCDRPSSA